MKPGSEELAALVASLEPLVLAMRDLDLSDPARAERQLAQRLPPGGDQVAAIRRALETGAGAGWLLPKEQGGIRFGRVAKDLHGWSVDAVRMDCAGPRHRHPNGEIDLLLPTQGQPRFDGRAPGWAVYPPGSVHVPGVTGGEMLILYFLPGGAIEFHPD
jgi:hypothetical protein